jgi:hypothetical protein
MLILYISWDNLNYLHLYFVLYHISSIFFFFYVILNFLDCAFGANLNSQIITIFLLISLLLLFNAHTKFQHDA